VIHPKENPAHRTLRGGSFVTGAPALLVVRRCVRERIVQATAIPFRGVRKSVDIFLDINRLEEESFVPNRLGRFFTKPFNDSAFLEAVLRALPVAE
jgi:hypothetical protein